ncbi:MAG: DNA internalization-related competence protein ComEC/Rec2 [Phycisphaerales bacterium]|nr:MAG: DNA internalization-related competence protein ComEC/Rec2 [Phycisphaerales bacterium]
MDEIRRKLELIDRQLARRDFHDHIITTCPLVFAAVGLIAGILVQSVFDAPVAIWLILLGLSAAGGVIFFAARPSSAANRRVTAYLALGCFACLGSIRLMDYSRPEPDDIRNHVADERKLATIRGLIVTDPYVSRYPDWKFARFKPTDPSTSFYMKVCEVKAIHGWVQTAGTVRVQVGEPTSDLKAGDAIRAYCWLDRFEPPTNPGQFDTAAYLARRNIFVAAFVNSRDGIEVLRSLRAGRFTRLRAQLRKLTMQALVGDVPEQDASRGLLEALLLGERRRIDGDTYRAFRKTGLLHFISLSGMHMGILFGIIWLASKTAGFMKPARAVICATAIGLFLLIVPPRAPTVRAAIICWVFCASILAHRRANPVNTLSLAAIILLLVRPTQLFEAGWQLSFASVLGIILLTDRIGDFLDGVLTGRLWVGTGQRKTLWSHTLGKFGLYARRLFSVGFAAWLGSAGVLLYHFHTINPFASVWTVLVFPLVSAILVFGFLKMILSLLLPTLSAASGIAVTLLSDMLIHIVKFIAHFDIFQILIGRVSLVFIVLYYCIIIFIGFVYLRRWPLLKTSVSAVMLLGITVYLGAVKWQRTYRDELVLTCLDVGHGQAILIQLPPKTNVLFDAGSLYRSDIGTRIVAPFLDYAGISRIDALIISHNDTDHINGIPEIVAHCKVGSVYANHAFFDKTDTWGTAQFLTDCLGEQGLEIERLQHDLNLHSRATVKHLWPDGTINGSEKLSDNDRSLVSLIEFAGVKTLLCSDIEAFAQRELLRLNPDLEADIVVIPHHGSAKTLASDFLAHLDAGVLAGSCDRSQYERIMKGPASAARSSDRSRYFYTAGHGAVRVCVRANGTTQANTFKR